MIHCSLHNFTLQSIVLISSIVYALLMISQSVKDWTENPVVTSIDTVEAPITDVPFPALSVCHASPNFHQNWQLPELILNFIDINSNSEDENVKKLVAGLSNFTDNVIDEYLALMSPYDVYDIKSSEVNFNVWGNNGYTTFHDLYCLLVHELSERLKKNPNLIGKLKRKWKHSVTVLKPFNLDVLLQEFKVEKGTKGSFDYDTYGNNYINWPLKFE